jgi:hypothetical protein
MGKGKKETKKKYEKPSYEVDGIFEKMSLKCHETREVPCKNNGRKGCTEGQPYTRSA